MISFKQLFDIKLWVLALLTLEAHAQQPNFSLYHYTPFFTNPGRIGVEQDVRLMLNYRNQSIEAGDNFRTSSLSAYYPVYVGNHRLVIAGNFMNDQASDFVATNGGLLGVAYGMRITERSELSLGVQAGVFRRNIDNDFTTDDQFVDGVFDPNAVSGDAVLDQAKSYPALSSGVYYLLRDEEGREKAFIGGALFNATEPDISFMDDGEDQLPSSLKATAGYRIYQGMKFSVLPTARWVNQADNNFLNIGSRFGYELEKTAEGVKKIDLGVWYHTNDLGVFSIAYEQPGLVIAASYDLPVEDDQRTTQNGIVELAVSFRLKRKNKPFVPRQIPAPTAPREEQQENSAEARTTPPGQETPVIEKEWQDETIEEQPAEEIKKELGEDVNELLTPAEQEVLDRTVRFQLNSDHLTDDSRRFLDEVSSILKRKDNFVVELIGHTCSLGSEEWNTDLSFKRARQVQRYLVAKGLDSSRSIVKGAGESQPLDDSQAGEARNTNRRVEFKVFER